MCKWNDTVDVEVVVPAHLSHTGEARRTMKSIDSCIAALVEALNKAGILTVSCCCGHGRESGVIMLADGRELIIKMAESGGTTSCSTP